MSGRVAKSDRRKVRKVLGDGAPLLLEAHEDGLRQHAEILRLHDAALQRLSAESQAFGDVTARLTAVVVAPTVWARLRWLLFGVPTHG